MTESVQAARLKIYFKSGNSVIIDGVTSYDSDTNREGHLKEVTFAQTNRWDTTWLDVASLSLEDIECIVRLPYNADPASAGETAGAAETEGLGAQHEHATPSGVTPAPSPHPETQRQESGG